MGEVIFNKNDIAAVNKRYIQFLKNKASKSPDGKARFCLHKELGDSLHEMIIVLGQDVYVRPHKHVHKIESFHIIEGSFLLAIFNDRGEVVDRILVGSQSIKENYLCKLEKNIWHTIIPLTDFVVFHETTNGPYIGKDDSVFAPWAPFGEGNVEVRKFVKFVLEF
jgi:cupin fold WbuC family metalloprotein